MPKLGIQVNASDRGPFRAASRSVIDDACKSEIGDFGRKVAAGTGKPR